MLFVSEHTKSDHHYPQATSTIAPYPHPPHPSISSSLPSAIMLMNAQSDHQIIHPPGLPKYEPESKSKTFLIDASQPAMPFFEA
jgi:hypothetical protein